MNAKNKKLLAIVGVAAVLLIVIGVSVSMLGKSSQPSGTDPAAAPTDVTTEDVPRPRRNSRRPARTMSRLFPIPPPISPKTAIRRTAPSTLRALAGFPMKEVEPFRRKFIQMEI